MTWLLALLWAAPALAQTEIAQIPEPAVAPSSAPYYGIPIPADRGPWVLGDVRFIGHRNVSDLALQNRVRARRGAIYAPSDLRDDASEIAALPNVRSAEALLFAMPDQPVPDSYLSIAISTMLVRVVYRVEEEVIPLPGLSAAATGQAQTPAKDKEKDKKPEAVMQEPPASMSGVILTPTAYRGTDRLNRPGLGLDINAAYYIGRLYGKNSLPYTTKKTNFIDRLGIWLLTADGKMQVQSETSWRPALSAGAQAVFHFRDAQPTLQTPTASVNLSEKTTRIMTGTYVVASKKAYGVRSSLGFMYGTAGDQTGLLSEFFTSQALLFGGHPNQSATSKSTLFGSLLYALRPDYPIGVEFIKPNGMPLAPLLVNFKLGKFLRLNFDVAYLRFQGGWDLLGLFQFRYTHFPKK